ncbi:MAG TPA: formyltransferase family protein [Gaiellaceae bacterium]|nr:formyltransferase family protein [Gaiellaceae bacterium]
MSLDPRLRIHFVTEDDPLYVIEFFETFFTKYPRSEFEIIGMSIQEPFNESRIATARRVSSLYGPLGFARLLGRIAVRKLRRRSIATLARREGVSLMPTKSVNDPLFVRRMKASQPDVIVSVAAPEIFKQEILQSPRLGCINIHSGRLPTYRGMMPTFWQMRFGEQHATVTVHEMAPALDAGAVLGTAECVIQEHDSLDRVMIAAKRAGAHLLIRVLSELAAGDSKPQPLDMENASYHSFPKRDDVKSFRKRGHRLL